MSNRFALRYSVAAVEGEVVLEHRLAEPHLGERVQQPLVVVVGDAASVLDLACDVVEAGAAGVKETRKLRLVFCEARRHLVVLPQSLWLKTADVNSSSNYKPPV